MKNSKSLQFNLVVRQILLLVLAIGVLIGINTMDQQQQIKKNVLKSTIIFANTLVSGIRHPMSVNNTDAIRHQMESIRTDIPDARYTCSMPTNTLSTPLETIRSAAPLPSCKCRRR